MSATHTRHETEHKSFEQPDEVREFPNGRSEILDIGGGQVGRLGIRMDDGTEFIAGPGDITSLPMGHDGWVVGDEPVVVVDWYGAGEYAKGD
jgi:hypothetical protein